MTSLDASFRIAPTRRLVRGGYFAACNVLVLAWFSCQCGSRAVLARTFLGQLVTNRCANGRRYLKLYATPHTSHGVYIAPHYNPQLSCIAFGDGRAPKNVFRMLLTAILYLTLDAILHLLREKSMHYIRRSHGALQHTSTT